MIYYMIHDIIYDMICHMIYDLKYEDEGLKNKDCIDCKNKDCNLKNEDLKNRDYLRKKIPLGIGCGVSRGVC